LNLLIGFSSIIINICEKFIGKKYFFLTTNLFPSSHSFCTSHNAGTRIQCVATLRYLKSGASAIRGSICFVNRTTEVLELMTLLPRLPEEMEIVELYKGRLARPPRKFKVRVAMVRRALEWLQEHHPAYRDIQICEEKMKRLEDGLIKEQMVIPRIEVPKNMELHANLGNMGSNQDTKRFGEQAVSTSNGDVPRVRRTHIQFFFLYLF